MTIHNIITTNLELFKNICFNNKMIVNDGKRQSKWKGFEGRWWSIR